MKPITPAEALKLRRTAMPDQVVEWFNRTLSERIKRSGCTITQQEALDALAPLLKVAPQEILDRGWLDVEEVYGQAGWDVEYDKPGYNEPGDAVWRFSARRGLYAESSEPDLRTRL